MSPSKGAEHVVEDLSFHDSWIDCRCGWSTRPPRPPVEVRTPEGVKATFEAHRREVGAPRIALSEVGRTTNAGRRL